MNHGSRSSNNNASTITSVPNSRFLRNSSNVNDLCNAYRMGSAWCYVALQALENLSALKAIVCMEFKVTKEKSRATKQKVTFLNKIGTIILTLAGFCCRFAVFHRLFGIFEVLVELSTYRPYAKMATFILFGFFFRFLQTFNLSCELSKD